MEVPTFAYNGNIAGCNPRTKKHVSLMFHTGATVPGERPILIGGGDTARYARFDDLDQVEVSAADLRAVIAAWCDAHS